MLLRLLTMLLLTMLLMMMMMMSDVVNVGGLSEQAVESTAWRLRETAAVGVMDPAASARFGSGC